LHDSRTRAPRRVVCPGPLAPTRILSHYSQYAQHSQPQTRDNVGFICRLGSWRSTRYWRSDIRPMRRIMTFSGWTTFSSFSTTSRLARHSFRELGRSLKAEPRSRAWGGTAPRAQRRLADIAMMRTPDGHNGCADEVPHAPPSFRAEPENAPATRWAYALNFHCRRPSTTSFARCAATVPNSLERDSRSIRRQLPALFLRGPEGINHRTGRAPSAETSMGAAGRTPTFRNPRGWLRRARLSLRASLRPPR